MYVVLTDELLVLFWFCNRVGISQLKKWLFFPFLHCVFFFGQDRVSRTLTSEYAKQQMLNCTLRFETLA